MMRKTLFQKAISVQGGALESRLVARAEDKGRSLNWGETKEECQYLLETIDYAGLDKEYTARIKKACRYILKQEPRRW